MFSLIIISFVSCKTDEQKGYNCNSGNCTAVFDNPQYLTLADCQSACENNNSNGGGGYVEITATWTYTYFECSPAYTVKIGLCYTSTDVANEAYFFQSSGDYYGTSSFTYPLASGTYYYKAKKTYNMSCGTGQGIPSIVAKSGTFTITANQTTIVNVGSLD